MALAGTLFAHLLVERSETWSQHPAPHVRGWPVPPLMLMLPPEKLGYSRPLAPVPGIPLAASYIGRPTGGYAGFGKLGDNDRDDVMFGIQDVVLRNLSDTPLRLSWTLTVLGEGERLELSGSGKGRWERQLNLNDYLASSDKPRLSWLLSPVELAPGASTPITSTIGFVAPAADAEMRRLILRGDLPAEYSATLTIRDENKNVVARLPLPFGVPPAPADDPASRALRRMMEGKQPCSPA